MEQLLQFFADNPAALFALITWELAWKGIALWKAAARKQFWWFVAILVFNTLGILPAVYIFYFSQRAKPENSKGGASPAGYTNDIITY